jgi:hypothetical protein
MYHLIEQDKCVCLIEKNAGSSSFYEAIIVIRKWCPQLDQSRHMAVVLIGR